VDNIKIDLTDIGGEGMDWIDLIHDRDQWRALVNTGHKWKKLVNYSGSLWNYRIYSLNR
jgi:hypothetical protein